MERGKAIDAIDYANARGWMDRLADSAGASREAILSAWNELKEASGSYFPDGNLIGDLLKSDDHDLFATYMARIALKRVSEPVGTSYEDHANYWADHWKIVFDSDAAVAE